MSSARARLTSAMAAMAGLALVIVAAYFETVRAMVEIWWRSETFTHAFLVPPIVGWLCWRQWPVLRQLPVESSAWAGVPLVVAGAAWLLGDLAAVNTVTQFSVVSMLVLLVPLVFGWTWTRVLLFPLAFLYFCVPFGEFAMPRLMEWTADFTVLALRLTGVPVFREGLQFVIPTGTWSVVEACSGIRYIIASLTVGTLFAYLNYQGTRKRLVFVGVALVVPVVANWVRAYLIVMLGHLSGNKLAAGVDHLIYGWVFFGIVIVLMFMIGARWADGEESATALGPKAVGSQGSMQTLSSSPVWVLCIGFLIVGAPWGAAAVLKAAKNKAEVQFPQRIQLSQVWRELDPASMDWSPDFKNPSAKRTFVFEKDGQKVGVYVAYYRDQNVTRKLVSSENVLVRTDNPRWAKLTSSHQELRVSKLLLPVQHATLRAGNLSEGKDAVRMHVYQTYWVNRSWMASDIQAKIAGAVSQLRGAGDDSAVLILYAMAGTGEESKRFLQDFLEDQLLLLETMLTSMASVGDSRN
jgi:exosortase A